MYKKDQSVVECNYDQMIKNKTTKGKLMSNTDTAIEYAHERMVAYNLEGLSEAISSAMRLARAGKFGSIMLTEDGTVEIELDDIEKELTALWDRARHLRNNHQSRRVMTSLERHYGK